NKCGEPESDNRFSGGGLTYPDFRAVFNANDTEIWHFTINKGVTLNSGLGVGSTRADINAVFGSGTSVYGKTRVQYDQYIVTFAFDGDRVNEIKIEPARGAFTKYRAIAPR
ncbi:MAG TPA: hypothetical protein VHS28_04160, partial [Chloroflexota bacterium]|nr:hypothetical protein [Chloroflexota bacterium]